MAPTILLFGFAFSDWPLTAGPGPCAVHAMGPIGGWPEAAMGSASATVTAKRAHKPVAARRRPPGNSKREVLLSMCRFLSCA